MHVEARSKPKGQACASSYEHNAFVPARVMELPLIVNAVAPALKLMLAKLVAEVRSLFGVARVVPAKTSASPATGAVPPQLAAVLQLSSPPAPVHVLVAAASPEHPANTSAKANRPQRAHARARGNARGKEADQTGVGRADSSDFCID